MGLFKRRPKTCPACGTKGDHLAFPGSALEHYVCTQRMVTPTLEESEARHAEAHAPFGCPYVREMDCQAFIRAQRKTIVDDPIH